MTDGLKGVAAMATAATIWGLSGIFYRALSAVPPIEVLCHRTIWSVVFFGLVLGLQGRGTEIREALAQRRTWTTLGLSALLISTNWLGFIYAVQNGFALEASLGYYIFPLVAVALGCIVFGERFRPVQIVAIGLATLAVLTQALGLGHVPWLALLLAGTFGLYGLIKKRLRLGPTVSVFIETLILLPAALAFLAGIKAGLWTDLGGRTAGLLGNDVGTAALLILSGPLTAVPLMLFSRAARLISYASLGLVQYLNPTLQFAVAVLVFGEPFTRWDAIAFPLIWTGLALYSWEVWRQERLSRSAAISSGTVP